MSSWSLDNAIELQNEFPYTFYRPSDAVIERLKPEAATVKLIFRFDPYEKGQPSAERMWVIITSVNKDGTYKGTLDNDPYYIKDLKAGDEITFRREHIIQYDTLDELDVEDINAEKVEQYLKKCFVSNHIMLEGYKVGRLYREELDEKEYTGWIFMSGYETQEYVDDPNNLQYIAIGTVLNLDDSFIHLLEAPIGSEFERDKATGTFYLFEE
ncbi:immunity protein Imm33 domain-containing protein [Mucilaginibacter lacusdianchii]|uniref:immunity protein Imm33 domain-containing protein n=1 Tax=Mucilaginibacter lacusdianchii TaxID=2684211 RepID=UPI00131CD6B9|nr:DUF2185 domain-containing protein [Mucilaginibacter sp. JXJ CY 39]